ncbi:MAG: phospholipase [Alphaproteobacteria bacterium]|nr:phospholipase [Alphaproteobacteria bacterium]
MVAHQTIVTLFTYGGGMRGLIPAHFMSRIEDATGYRMAEMVDVFCGPSTGAILNSALTLRHAGDPNRPRYKARHLVRFYEREGLKIFPPDRFREFRGFIHDFNNRTMKLNQLNALFRHGHYDPRNLARALRALYGRARIEDSLRSLIVPTYNIEGEQIHAASEENESGDAPVRTRNNTVINQGGQALWLKNIIFPGAVGKHRRSARVSLYDAVMASCAAPTYFPCHHFKARYNDASPRTFSCIDGSIFDNPCISYLGAVRPHLPPGTRHVMIVLGTGYTHRAITREEWNRYGALGVVDPVNDLPLINILFHASESALMDAFADEAKEDLFVFNKSLVPDGSSGMPNAEIDDASAGNLHKLEHFAAALLEENRKSFDRLCHILATHKEGKDSEALEPGWPRFKNPFTFWPER